MILIASDKGISLIHDSGILRNADIEQEFNWHDDTINFWGIAFNPNFYTADKDDLREYLIRLQEIAFKVMGENTKERLNLYEISGQKISISRDHKIMINRTPARLVEYPLKYFREVVDRVNYYFSNGESIPADLQFDGIKYTPLPKLLRRADQAAKIARSTDYKMAQYTKLFFKLQIACGSLLRVNSESRLKTLLKSGNDLFFNNTKKIKASEKPPRKQPQHRSKSSSCL